MRLQRTVKNPVTFKGKGIHSGNPVVLTVKSADPDSGINFVRIDIKNKPSVEAKVLNLSDYSKKLRCTSLEKNGVLLVSTIEHLMSALMALSIDNAIVEINNAELPILDGSAAEYAVSLKKSGTIEQNKEKRELTLKEAVFCREGDAILIAMPSDNLKISYLLSYKDNDMAVQYAEFELKTTADRERIFITDIAPARTYCMEEEIKLIESLGLGKGGDLTNTLVIKDGKPIDNKFRLRDELARHKILDLMGDLALLSADVRAEIIAIRSGHSLNAGLVKKLSELL